MARYTQKESSFSSGSNGWNAIYKEERKDDDPWSDSKFGSMSLGHGLFRRKLFQSQQHEQGLDESVTSNESKSILNSNKKSNSDSPTGSNIDTMRPRKRRKIQNEERGHLKRWNGDQSEDDSNVNGSTNNTNTESDEQSASRRHSTCRSIRRRPQTQRGREMERKEMEEIRRYQGTGGLLLNRTAFGRLVREIGSEYKNELRFTKAALEALQQVTEWYIVGMFQDSNLCAIHGHRIKLQPKDVQLAQRLKDCKNTQFTF